MTSSRRLGERRLYGGVCGYAPHAPWTFTLSDSFGDGWNGAVATITDCGGDVSTHTLDGGSYGTAEVSMVYSVDVSSGSFPSEISWALNDPCGDEVLSGGAPGYVTQSCPVPPTPAPTSASTSA